MLFFFFFTIVFLFLPFSFYRRPVLPDILVQVICWVLGEYAYLKGADAIAEVCDPVMLSTGAEGTHEQARSRYPEKGSYPQALEWSGTRQNIEMNGKVVPVGV